MSTLNVNREVYLCKIRSDLSRPPIVFTYLPVPTLDLVAAPRAFLSLTVSRPPCRRLTLPRAASGIVE